MKKQINATLKRQNEWIKENRERQTITFPKGTKERIINCGGKSVNDFVNKAVEKELKRIEKTAANAEK